MPAVDTALLPDLLADVRALRERFSACCGELAAAERGADADALARALASHLASTTSADLPAPARVIWQDRIARPLKADASKPLPARSIGAIRSWPSARVSDLGGALVEIEAILAAAENEALNEVIYAEISRAYS